MRGSSYFRLRVGGGRTESTVDSTSSIYLQWDQLSVLKKTVLFGAKGGPTFFRGGCRTQLLISYRTCDFSR